MTMMEGLDGFLSGARRDDDSLCDEESIDLSVIVASSSSRLTFTCRSFISCGLSSSLGGKRVKDDD